MTEVNLLLLVQFLKLNLCIVYLLYFLEKLQKRPIRRWAVKPFNSVENRLLCGAYTSVFCYFKEHDHEEFFNYTRMSVKSFTYLYELISPKLTKVSNKEPLHPELRLVSVLNCLAHGMPIRGQAWSFRVGRSTMYELIPEVCKALIEVLAPRYMPFPNKEDWRNIAEEIYTRWNLPNCIGALDGKHYEVYAPAASGSAFYNYKNYFSVVALATCDAHLRFTWTSIGGYGASNDATLFNNSDLGMLLEQDKSFIPNPDCLPGTDVKFPFYFIGDAAFALKDYLMTPYSRIKDLSLSQRIYNYRICRGRRLIESSFGVHTKRWRILDKPMNYNLATTEDIILATMCLQNFIISMEMNLPEEQQMYIKDFDKFIPHKRNQLENRTPPHIKAVAMRSTLQQYFVSPSGSVPWQFQKI